ncbi:MAG: GAF domain-containing protein [Propionicimonas sp.]
MRDPGVLLPSPVKGVEELCRAALAIGGPAGLTSGSVARVVDGRPRSVLWASDERARYLDDLQVVLGEGPCVTAVAEGGPVMVSDLREHWRQGWLDFDGAAAELGVRSICAFPLQIGAVRLGVLTLHGVEPVSLDAAQLSQVFAVCDDLSVALLATDAGSGDWVSVLDEAMDRPLAITAQAAGMVMVQLKGTISEAMVRLCAHSFAEGMSLEEVSRSVVERTFRFEPDQFYPDPSPGTPQLGTAK